MSRLLVPSLVLLLSACSLGDEAAAPRSAPQDAESAARNNAPQDADKGEKDDNSVGLSRGAAPEGERAQRTTAERPRSLSPQAGPGQAGGSPMETREKAAGGKASGSTTGSARQSRDAPDGLEALGYLGDELVEVDEPMRLPVAPATAPSAGEDKKYRAAVPTQPQRTTSTSPQDYEQYTDYGINDMTLVEKDAQSTFSVDVDTASYTIARRKLSEGSLPSTASVRVEEFINYFPYDYPAPPTSGAAPFAVYLEAAPSPFLSGHHVMRVGVKGADIDRERKPVHLTFLVDTSGSMSSADKMGLVKRSLRTLVENLGPQDTVAIATYAGSVRRVLDPTPASSRSLILGAIDDLDASGSTAMASGIDLAYEMARTSAVYGEENRVIVCSDGDANVGPTSHEQILESVKRYAEQGITLSTIGFGMGNYKDTLMEQLANQGDGNYFYIDRFDEARRVFGEQLTATTQVIAKDVKIQVEFNPESVMAYRLIGYENRDIADRDFRNDRVDAGEIGAGHTVTALYDVVLRDGYDQQLATVRLRAKKPGPDSPAKEWATPFPAEQLRESFDASSENLRIAFAAATFAELLRGSPYLNEVSYSDVWRIAEGAKRSGTPEDQELVHLVRDAGELSGERGAAVAWR